MSITSSISLVNSGSMTASTSGKQDRVKVAIEPNVSNVQPLLMDFEHSLQLTTIVRDVATKWEIKNPEQYCFKYAASNKDSKGLSKFCYITEENRHELKNGDILSIALSPSLRAREIFEKIRTNDQKSTGISELADLSRDPTFAIQFISLNEGKGVQSLMSMIEKSVPSNTPTDKGDLANILGGFQELMEHSIVSWDTIGENFVKKIINILDRSRSKDYFHPPIVHRCLDILESIVMNSTQYYCIVAHEVPPSSVIGFISKGSQFVTHYALALINALILKAQDQPSILHELSINNFSTTINDNILQQARGEVDHDIAHQLSIYQSFILNQVENRMRTSFADGQPRMEESLRLLPVQAFSEEYRNKGANAPIHEHHWKQLGFSQTNPRLDFQETPPGVLALDCMVYLARTKHEIYTRLLFAQMDNPCPFAQTSIALTKILCQLFRIGEQTGDIGYFQEFIPFLILNEEPFKEIFCITIQLLFKTWREMRAGIMDLEKVTAVVTKQITMVLQSQDTSTLTSSEVLKSRLFELNYKKIIAAEEQSQLLDEAVLKSRPVQDLRIRITPEIYELVKQERLHHLIQGAAFPKIGGRRRDQFFYCRLAPNHKIIHFGDTAGQTAPPLETLENKVQISDTKLVTGTECPHAERARKNINLIFSLIYNGDEHLDFCAPTETVYNIWVDGLNALLGRRMTSKAAEEDLETLLNMDLKLRLLDLENITIPTQQPPIPPEPNSYNFYYKLD